MLQMKPRPQKIALPGKFACAYLAVVAAAAIAGAVLGGRTICAVLACIGLCGFVALDALNELRIHPRAAKARRTHSYATVLLAVVGATACVAALVLT